MCTIIAEESLNDLDTEQLLALLVHVDMAEVAQAQAVFDVVVNIVEGGTGEDGVPFQNIYPEENDQTTAKPGSGTGTGIWRKRLR